MTLTERMAAKRTGKAGWFQTALTKTSNRVAYAGHITADAALDMVATIAVSTEACWSPIVEKVNTFSENADKWAAEQAAKEAGKKSN